MKETIIINLDTNVAKDGDYRSYWRRMGLYQACIYVKELLKARGYIYLNQIYESLEVKWDPNRDNVCIRADDGNGFDFIIRDTLVPEGFEVDINW